MTEDRQQRHVFCLVTDPTGAALLVNDRGGLPSLMVEFADGDTSVLAALRAVRSAFSLEGPLLEIHFDHDQAHDDEGAGPVPTLIVVESPPVAWLPPAGTAWRQIADTDPDVAPGLRMALAELITASRAGPRASPLLPRWSRSGWFAGATAWIRQQLTASGRTVTGPVEQFRHWGISAVMRVETAEGRAWFKAVFPLFQHEPAVTAMLHREAPGSVAPVIATKAQEGWLLLDDVGSDVVADHPDCDVLAIQQLVTLQQAFVGRTAELISAGCPDRRFSTLPDALADMFEDPVVVAWIDVTPERAATIVAWARRAAADVDRLPFPDTLVHGDFHPYNVALSKGRAVIFDWSDAAIGHPLVDPLTWSSFLSDDADRGERAWMAALDAWSAVCPIDRVEALRPALVGLAAGYQAVSYAAIVTRLEHVRRRELADGLQYYFARLDASVPI